MHGMCMCHTVCIGVCVRLFVEVSVMQLWSSLSVSIRCDKLATVAANPTEEYASE